MGVLTVRAALALGILLASSVAVADPPDAPIRARRRLGISAGVGLRKGAIEAMPYNITYHARPHISFAGDFAVTEALIAVGLRSRWNVLTSGLTPFLEGGCELHFGLKLGEVPDEDGQPSAYRSASGLALQVLVGAEWVLPFGLTLRVAGGYSLDTGPRYAADAPLPAELEASLNRHLGSGFLLRGGVGWTF
jgi:hypothetical protein